ncbi:unnamed protein product [Plutella xylostella]|uniref:aralkylamine N-acetyltransferase n=1 Tax=Plutella xylostella TaxID=51655 RepID=A0A8S4FS11_PLUXY|nr:unnamed protein product [Plutella xylostella]
MTEHGYTVEAVKPEDHDEIMRLLKMTFYLDEPLNHTVGLGADCSELDQFCGSSLLEGLSFKAVDREGNVAGVIISGVCPLDANIIEEMQNHTKNCKNPKFQKILYILTQREIGSRLWEKYPEETQFVEIKVTATHVPWRKKGIMNALVARTELAVKERGIRLLRLDTSSAYSAKSAERLGFNSVYTELYSNIKMDGKPVIVPPPPHLEDKVYLKVLY